MRTVNEVSKLSGVSIRTLHYYDTIGLLQPTQITDSGYRIYDDTALERLQHILLFRELQFPLKEIKKILDSPNFDRNKALEQQIEMLTLKKEHLENLINFARGIRMLGVNKLDFKAFDTTKLDDYARQAKEKWGHTEAYQEFEQKQKQWKKGDMEKINSNLMKLFEEFGELKDLNPADAKVQAQVKKLQEYITEHFYTCANTILSGLGKMYAGGGSMTENIDKAGGKGTAEFTCKAIEVYCKDS